MWPFLLYIWFYFLWSSGRLENLKMYFYQRACVFLCTWAVTHRKVVSLFLKLHREDNEYFLIPRIFYISFFLYKKNHANFFISRIKVAFLLLRNQIIDFKKSFWYQKFNFLSSEHFFMPKKIICIFGYQKIYFFIIRK